MESARKHLVVIGGGQGAYNFLTNLQRVGDFQLTLVSTSAKFSFQPLISEVIGGNLQPEHTDTEWKDIIGKLKFFKPTVLVDNAIKVDYEDKTITLERNKPIEYDYLVISVGAKNIDSFSGSEKVHWLSTGSDAKKIRDAIKDLSTKGMGKVNFLFVGGGATTVEACANTVEYLQANEGEWKALGLWEVVLVTSSERILPTYSFDSSKKCEDQLVKMGVKIQKKTKLKAVETKFSFLTDQNGNNEEKITTDFVMAAIGLRPNDFTRLVSSSKSGYLTTNNLLRIVGTQHQVEFAIGDCKEMEPDRISVTVQKLFKQANPPSNWWLKENRNTISTSFPQIMNYSSVPNVDWESRQALTEKDFLNILKKLDAHWKPPPKTAQTASQEGKYLGSTFQTILSSSERSPPPGFVYDFKGRACYIGNGAIVEKPDGSVSSVPGKMWRMFYLTMAPSEKRVSIAKSWMSTMFKRYQN